MAIVYKAYDTRLEREVAIKVIRTELFGEAFIERILKRFEREAKALARLDHPNIIKVHDYGEYENAPYLVMQYMRSGTLKDMVGKPMPYQDAAKLFIPIAQALSYAHENGVLHREIY
jgi:eukaryotic-like serine/threonine-protein kinase